MEEEEKDPVQAASDNLAAFLRDCLIGLIVLAMIGWLIYVGVSGIITGHLDLGHGVRASRRWFTRPIDGTPAIIAGISFLCLAATFICLGTSHPRISQRFPSWMRASYGWFFAGWALLYFTARFMSAS